MRKWYVFVGIIALVSCTSNVHLTLIDPYVLYHGNTCKMWVVNKVSRENVDYTPEIYSERDVVFFFADQNAVYIQPMASIGEAPNLLGEFYVSSDDHSLEFVFKQETWLFRVAEATKHKIVLRPQADSDFQYQLELVPYFKKFR